MIRFIGKRILQMIPVVLLVATLIFGILYLVPGDPAQIQQSRIGTVNDPALLQGLDGSTANYPRGLEIRLAHPQTDDPFHVFRQIEEFPDTGGLDLLNGAGKQLFVFYHGETIPLSSMGSCSMKMPFSL